MSSVSDNSDAMTSIAQIVLLDWTTDAATSQDYGSSTDSPTFKAVLIVLYSTVFCLCVAGQFPHCCIITQTNSHTVNKNIVSTINGKNLTV